MRLPGSLVGAEETWGPVASGGKGPLFAQAPLPPEFLPPVSGRGQMVQTKVCPPCALPAWRGQPELGGLPRRAPPSRPGQPAAPSLAATGQQLPGKSATWVCPAQPDVQEGGTAGRRPHRGGSRGPGAVGTRGQSWGPGKEAERTEMVGRGQAERTRHRGGGMKTRRREKDPEERDLDEREAARPRQEGGKEGGRGREQERVMGREREGGSWPGEAEPGWPSPARPAWPSPQGRCSCHTRARPRGQSCPGAEGK